MSNSTARPKLMRLSSKAILAIDEDTQKMVLQNDVASTARDILEQHLKYTMPSVYKKKRGLFRVMGALVSS